MINSLPEIVPVHGKYPPGHYYSPLPDLAALKQREQEIFSANEEPILGINIREEQQLELIKKLESYQAELPFLDYPSDTARYYYNNRFFSHADAVILYSLMRYNKPKRIVEAGSGFSSALILDTNDTFLNRSVECSFIEPFPERLLSLVDRDEIQLYECGLENAPLSCFTALEESDILFVDTSHVSKAGSDVNYLFSKILPRLNKGVWVHFHDIFYPFEYPKEWLYMGRFWNEAYLLRAFLQYNDAFEIMLWNDYLVQKHKEKVIQSIPKFKDFIEGTAPTASIWLRKAK